MVDTIWPLKEEIGGKTSHVVTRKGVRSNHLSTWLEKDPQHKTKKAIKGEQSHKSKQTKAMPRVKKEEQTRVKQEPMEQGRVEREGVKLEPKQEMITEPE